MFRKKLGNKGLVGLDIGSSSVKAVELSGKPGSLSLVNLGFEGLQPDTVVDGQIMELNDVSGVISGVFSRHQFKTDRVAAGVSGSSSSSRHHSAADDEENSKAPSTGTPRAHPVRDIDVSPIPVVAPAPTAARFDGRLKALLRRQHKQAIQIAGKQPDVSRGPSHAELLQAYQPAAELVGALLNVVHSTMKIKILPGAKRLHARLSVGGTRHVTASEGAGLTYERRAVKRGGEAANVGRESRPSRIGLVNAGAGISKTLDSQRDGRRQRRPCRRFDSGGSRS